MLLYEGDQAEFKEIYDSVVCSFHTQIVPMLRDGIGTEEIEFGIFYSKGQGNSRQKLIPFRPSYSARDINTLKINCLYIKPSVTLLEVSETFWMSKFIAE